MTRPLSCNHHRQTRICDSISIPPKGSNGPRGISGGVLTAVVSCGSLCLGPGRRVLQSGLLKFPCGSPTIGWLRSVATRGSMAWGSGQRRGTCSGECANVPFGVEGNALCSGGLGLELCIVNELDAGRLAGSGLPWSTWTEWTWWRLWEKPQLRERPGLFNRQTQCK
jgi:hypothetical protein